MSRSALMNSIQVSRVLSCIEPSTLFFAGQKGRACHHLLPSLSEGHGNH